MNVGNCMESCNHLHNPNINQPLLVSLPHCPNPCAVLQKLPLGDTDGYSTSIVLPFLECLTPFTRIMHFRFVHVSALINTLMGRTLFQTKLLHQALADHTKLEWGFLC